MSAKEITVFIIGVMLVGFLYFMKFPQDSRITLSSLNSQQSNTNEPSDEEVPFFDLNSEKPILDRILDIPAWNFDLSNIGALTVEEILKSIALSVEEKRFFEPENNNALFYLVNLKSLESENDQIGQYNQILIEELASQSIKATNEHDEKAIKRIISLYKSLNSSTEIVESLSQQLSTISTINKLYAKGMKQLSNEAILTLNSDGAWHTAKQSLEIDPQNTKTKALVSEVINELMNKALRAAEEIDFQLAFDTLEYAELLSPAEISVAFTKDRVVELKQQRYIWLESQLSSAIKQLKIDRANRMIDQMEDLGIDQSELASYKNELNRIEIFGQFREFDIFSDTTQNNQKLPEMVVMPIGEYIMGNKDGPKHEKPERIIFINYGFAVSQNEISVADFKVFVDSTGYETDAQVARSSRIYDLRTGRIKNKNRVNWEDDYLGNKAKQDLPVIHVSWNDAIAYTKWISQETGKNYRLLSESEFEYVLRAGSRTKFPWGDDSPKQIIENLTGKLDRTSKNTRIRWKKGFEKYNDKYWGPAPVGSFIQNQFRLNDTAGNVMEWVMDCWHDSYVRAPSDGSAWVNLGCENHVIRGGSWSSSQNDYGSSHRFIAKSNFTDARLGFRIAVDLMPQ
ncbi:MAG: formylglycine-generating enzyme family protein [Marinicellaceae bacterium]